MMMAALTRTRLVHRSIQSSFTGGALNQTFRTGKDLTLRNFQQPFGRRNTSVLQSVINQKGVSCALGNTTCITNSMAIRQQEACVLFTRIPGYRSFHTSQQRHVHPVLWMLVKPLAKFTSLLTGRFLRRKWQKMDPKDKTKMKKSIMDYRGTLMALAALGIGGLIANYYMHLQSTPITNRVRYVAFTREQFNKIADFEFEMHKLENKDKIVSDKHPIYNLVIAVANKIVAANQDIDFFREQNWVVWVINNKEPNAFVLPNGHIFVYTGLLQVAQTTDQLAVVLGHEMAHALLSHSAEQVSFAQFLDWFIILSLAALWFFVPSDGIALVTQWFYNKVLSVLLHLPYSRKLELEADEVGLQLIAKACYDVRESATFWSIMKLIMEHGSEDYVEVPEWISTHPSNDTRVETFNEMIPKAIDMRRYCKCAELPKKDPRDAIITIKKIISEEADPPQEETKSVPKGTKQGA